jgi:transcriptional regulator with XRE-family HTH domain
MSLTLELVSALKRLLKTQGMTYAQLAQRLELSEATVKRMFSRKSLNVRRLEEICDVLGVGLIELAEHARARGEPLTELTAEQEEALLKEPALLLALYLSLSNWQESEVLARYSFSRPEWTRLLARLDRMGVLDLLPGNRVRLRTARNFRWRGGGPIEQYFQTRLLPEFFARDFHGPHATLRLLTGMMAPHSADTLQRRLADFTREFDLLLAHDASLPIAQRIGVSFVLATRPWELSAFDRWRRREGKDAPGDGL